jgi:hypothetical protein
MQHDFRFHTAVPKVHFDGATRILTEDVLMLQHHGKHVLDARGLAG